MNCERCLRSAGEIVWGELRQDRFASELVARGDARRPVRTEPLPTAFERRSMLRTNPSRPYSRSEVIHRAGDESLFPAFERERPRIVNNFASSAPSGYEFSSSSQKMNSTRLSNLPVVLGSGNEYSDEDQSALELIRS